MIEAIKGLEQVRFEADDTFKNNSVPIPRSPGRQYSVQHNCTHQQLEIKLQTTEDARLQPVVVCSKCDRVWSPVSAHPGTMEQIRRGFKLEPALLSTLHLDDDSESTIIWRERNGF